VAVLLAALGTPVARRLALRTRFLDHPGEHKGHGHPTPLLGGVAIYTAVLGALMVTVERREIAGAVGILLGATLVSFLGVWDDRSNLRVSIKLTGQVLAALVLVLAGVQVLLPLPSVFNLGLTLLWVVGVTNAFNLLDNMDGLCGGVGAIAAAAFLLLALLNGQQLVAPLAAALLGACVGFLFYNFNPAVIFLGDSGSLFLGFMLAACGIKLRFPHNVPQVTWMVPVLVLAVPIFDTTLVVFSRLRRGRNPLSSPGRDHLSHRLVLLGLSHRRAVSVIYALGIAAGILGVVASLADRSTATALFAAVGVVGSAGILWLDRDSLAPRRRSVEAA